MRKFVLCLFFLLLTCGCTAIEPLLQTISSGSMSPSSYDAPSIPPSHDSSSSSHDTSSITSSQAMHGIGGSILTPIDDIPKPSEPPPPWGFSNLNIPGLRLVKDSNQQLGKDNQILYLDEDTIVFVSSYRIYFGDLLKNQPKNTVSVYEYKISTDILRCVYQKYVGSENGNDISSFHSISRLDKATILITDRTSYSLSLSIPDYKQISDNDAFHQNDITTVSDYSSWRAKEFESFENGGEILFANEDHSITLYPENFYNTKTNDAIPQLVVQFTNNKNKLIIPVDKTIPPQVSNYALSRVFFGKKQPYLIALLEKYYNRPANLPEDISAQHYWIENCLLICNYKTGEYAFSPAANGVSDMTNFAFNSIESNAMLITIEFDQFKVKPEETYNQLFYSFAYLLNLQEFIINNNKGGFLK